jgi:subtilisin family serine protease
MKTLTRQMSFSLQRSPLLAGLALLLLAGMPPAKKTALDTKSAIVQAETAARAAELVRAVGGTVTHELGIIDAVAAGLTSAQLEAIRQSDAGARIYDNGQAELAAKGGKNGGGETTTTPTIETVGDDFNIISYVNGNGTQPWLGAWEERNDDGTAGGGNVRIQNMELYLDNKDGGSLESISRAADLSLATTATLNLNFSSFGEGGLDIVAVEASDDGGTNFVPLESIEIVGTPGGSRQYLLEQSIALTGNVVVRFRIVQGLAATTQYVAFDDVTIEYTTGDSGSTDEPTSNGISESHYPAAVGADLLHAEGIDGSGVTVGFIDTGMWNTNGLLRDTQNGLRFLFQYDAILNKVQRRPGHSDDDYNGHGSHVAGVSVSSNSSNTGKVHGVAPGARLISAKAFDGDGIGTYADVIRALDKAVQYKDDFNIRVLNLSFSATPQSHYWDDPLNQAVMQAWQAGIVVIASAGNGGPDAMSIGVPGNVPYIITVGAMTDSLTPSDPSDDTLASFSAAGPTYEGFVKPELVAPGGHILSLMEKSDTLPTLYPEFHDGQSYFTMSGTSQAAAVVTGVVALMLQADPALTPDDVKCRLMAAARPAINADGTLAYSVFQQGAGLVNAYDAVYATDTGCANNGLDIGRDLDGVEHYGGPGPGWRRALRWPRQPGGRRHLLSDGTRG